jgi:hypothetical protein
VARATTVTWLSLDRWAQIIGIDPLIFNGLISRSLQSETCGDVWFQYAWQDANKISREDIAQAIQDAEKAIANYVGYPLLPDWFEDDGVPTVRPSVPTLFSNGRNIRGMAKSVFSQRGYVISGGIRAKSLVVLGSGITRTDNDGDGYKETATVSILTTVTDPDEIHLYYPGQVGADEWEIRPIKVSIVGGMAVITFHSSQIVDPDLLEQIDASAQDADVDANYVITADVYRVYNDPQTQVQMLWENTDGDCGSCETCEWSEQYGCLAIRNPKLGEVSYHPATWNAVTAEFDSSEYSLARDPDRLHLYYRAGWKLSSLTRPYCDMDPYWERAVAYYACGLLDRDICECNNARAFVNHWREEVNKTTSERSFNVSPRQLDNVFGSTRGALYALARCMQEGRKLGR